MSSKPRQRSVSKDKSNFKIGRKKKDDSLADFIKKNREENTLILDLRSRK